MSRAGGPTVSIIDQRRFGDLAEDVVFLRDRGLIVAPFKGMYRIDNDTYTADGVRSVAHRLRQREPSPRLAAKRAAQALTVDHVAEPAPAAVEAVEEAAAPASPAPSPPALCPCSRPRGHGGRCWFKRGMTGPPIRKKAVRLPVQPLPSDAITARLQSMEARLNKFMRLLSIAIGGRRTTLEQQAAGLAELEAELQHDNGGP